MTEVVILKDSRGNIQGYVAEGHSGYGRHGEDIVCAAISVLTQTALLSLNKVCKIREKDIEFRLKDGYLKVMLKGGLGAKARENANLVLETMVVGLESIVEEYPDFITLKYREVD
jgi:uncharacterized protein